MFDPLGSGFTIEGGKGLRPKLVGMCRWTCLTCCASFKGNGLADAELLTGMSREAVLDGFEDV